MRAFRKLLGLDVALALAAALVAAQMWGVVSRTAEAVSARLLGLDLVEICHGVGGTGQAPPGDHKHAHDCCSLCQLTTWAGADSRTAQPRPSAFVVAALEPATSPRAVRDILSDGVIRARAPPPAATRPT